MYELDLRHIPPRISDVQQSNILVGKGGNVGASEGDEGAGVGELRFGVEAGSSERKSKVVNRGCVW